MKDNAAKNSGKPDKNSDQTPSPPERAGVRPQAESGAATPVADTSHATTPDPTPGTQTDAVTSINISPETPAEPKKPAATGPASTSDNKPIQDDNAGLGAPDKLPEELMNDETLPETPHQPLAGQPINRGYEGGPESAGAGTGTPPPPSGSGHTAPPANLPDPDAEDLTKPQPTAPGSKPAETLTPDQKRRRAEKAVDKFFMGYGILKSLIGYIGKVRDGEMDDYERKNELSRGMMVRVRKTGQEIPLGEVIENYNAAIDETVAVKPELIADTKEDLIEIAIERNIGLSKEASVVISFAKDLGETSMDMFTMKASINNLLEFQKEKYKEEKEQQRRAQNPPPPQPEQRTGNSGNVKAEEAVLVVEEPAEK